MSARTLHAVIFLLPFIGLAQNIDSLRPQLSENITPEQTLNIYHQIADYYAFTNFDSSIAYAKKGLDFAQSYAPSLVGQPYYDMALAAHVANQFDTALRYYDAAQIAMEAARDSIGLARVFNNLGVLYVVNGNYPRALDVYQKSLQLKLANQQYKGLGNTYNNIGNIKYELRQYNEAMVYYDLALIADDSVGNVPGIARALGNKGLASIEQKAYEAAIDYYSRAFELVKTHEIPIQNAYNAVGLADAYQQMNVPDSAFKYAQLAYELGQAQDDPVILASSLHTLGQMAFKNGNIRLAEQQLHEALRIAEEHQLPSNVKEVSFDLYELYKSTGQYNLSLQYHERFHTLADSLFNEEINKKLTASELTFAFQQEKDSLAFANEKERFALNAAIEQEKSQQVLLIIGMVLLLALLLIIYWSYRLKVRTNQKLEEKNGIISQSLTERESLIKEIHHRVKNNLQIISSLLNIQSRFIKDDGAKSALTNMRTRVMAMSLVHENLYKTDNVTHVYTDEYIENLAMAIDQTLNRDEVNFSTEIDHIRIPSELAVKVGLLTNELLTNAYKHAFPPGFEGLKQINLTVAKEDNNLKVAATDTGVGMPEITNEGSYGIQLIRSLTSSLQGTFTVTGQKKNQFTLLLPLPYQSDVA